MLWTNIAEIDMVKPKKIQELGVLTLGIKRDGHKKNPGIRKSGNQKFRELGGKTVFAYQFQSHALLTLDKYD